MFTDFVQCLTFYNLKKWDSSIFFASSYSDVLVVVHDFFWDCFVRFYDIYNYCYSDQFSTL